MYIFLIPLIFGFACNLGSAFTGAFSKKWGDKRGSLITFVLRDILGIPVWAIGFILAAQYESPALFSASIFTEVAGWVMISAGGVIILIALATIRLRSIRPSAKDSLAHSGIYTYVRHPIHSGVLLEFLGLVLASPRWTLTLACMVGVIWVLLQTRCEEADLLQRLPEYKEYMQAVPRFLPRIKARV